MLPTTIIPFALQKKGGSIKVAIDEYHVKACGNSIVDYAFHMILTDPSEIILNKELPDLIKSGYTHFKIYMTSRKKNMILYFKYNKKHKLFTK